MAYGRIGGLLVIGGCALLPLLVATGGSGPAGVDGHPPRDISNLVLNVSLALLGSGLAVLSLAGPGQLHRRPMRTGLGLLAVGLLGLLVSSIVPIPAGSNSLQHWPYVISATVGLLATAGGTLVTVLSLLRVSGRTRMVGSLLLAGLLLLPLAAILSVNWVDQPLESIAGVLQLIGFSGIVAGLVGIGLLGITSDRSSVPASR